MVVQMWWRGSAHQLLATSSPPLSVCITSSTLSWVTSPSTPSTSTRSNQPSSQTFFHPRNVSEPPHDYNPSGQTCEKHIMVLTVEEYLRCASGASSFPEEAANHLPPDYMTHSISRALSSSSSSSSSPSSSSSLHCMRCMVKQYYDHLPNQKNP